MQVLTSKLTFESKFLWPPVSIAFFEIYMLALFIAPNSIGHEQTPPLFAWYALAVVVLLAATSLRNLGLKVVSREGTEFVISNYWRAIRVPVRDAVRVSAHALTAPELITLHFRPSTEFGPKITFMPKQRVFGGFSVHPLVKELSDLAHTLQME